LLSIKRRSVFKRVYDTGRRRGDGLLLIVAAPCPHGTYLGISVSKKVGTAVTRNRVRRLIKENFRLRLRQCCVKDGFEIVVTARPCAAEADFYKIGESMDRLFGHLNLGISE